MDFADRAGVAKAITAWGAWWQTIDEIGIEVSAPGAARGKDVSVTITAKHIKVAAAAGSVLLEASKQVISVLA